MSTKRKMLPSRTEANEDLQARYKPIGLRAVVAATQCRPEAKSTQTREHDIPAVLQALPDDQ